MEEFGSGYLQKRISFENKGIIFRGLDGSSDCYPDQLVYYLIYPNKKLIEFIVNDSEKFKIYSWKDGEILYLNNDSPVSQIGTKDVNEIISFLKKYWPNDNNAE